jgi:hypothetical protein
MRIFGEGTRGFATWVSVVATALLPIAAGVIAAGRPDAGRPGGGGGGGGRGGGGGVNGCKVKALTRVPLHTS